MTNIERLTEINLGGGNCIFFKELDKVFLQYFPIELNAELMDKIFLTNGEIWNFMEFTKDSLLFTEKLAQEHGVITELTAIIPKDRKEIIDFFNKFKKKRLIVIYINNNKKAIVIGNPDEPVMIDIKERANAKQLVQRNEMQVVLLCKRKNNSPFYKDLYINDLYSLLGNYYGLTTESGNIITSEGGDNIIP